MRGLRRGGLLGRVVLLGLGILELGRRGRGIERVFFTSFLLILVYILLHIGILLWLYLLWMDRSFFVTLVILLNDWEAIASQRVIDYVKVEENPMFRPPDR